MGIVPTTTTVFCYILLGTYYSTTENFTTLSDENVIKLQCAWFEFHDVAQTDDV